MDHQQWEPVVLSKSRRPAGAAVSGAQLAAAQRAGAITIERKGKRCNISVFPFILRLTVAEEAFAAT